MAKPYVLFWFEPYWSHHARPLPTRLEWLVPRAQALRCGLVALATWAIGAGLVWALFPAQLPALIVAAEALLLMLGVAVFIGAFYSLAVPRLYWLIPPCVFIHRRRLEILGLIGDVSIKLGQPGLRIIVEESSPGRQTLTISWAGGMRRVGVGARVDLKKLEHLTQVALERRRESETT